MNLQKVLCVALVTDASALVLNVSICLPYFQIFIQKPLGFSLLIVSEIMLSYYSTCFGIKYYDYYIFLYIFQKECWYTDEDVQRLFSLET